MPPALGGGAHGVGMTPQWDEDVLAELAQAFEPGACGQGSEETRGQIFIPPADPCEFLSAGTPKEGGEHETKDFAQELLVGFQTSFELKHEVLRETQVMERLMQSVDGPLGLLALALVASLGVETATASGFDLFGGVSCG